MMHTADMLKAFAPYREDAIVVPGRGGRYWTDLTTRPNLDVPVGDPAMGGHAGFALGGWRWRDRRRGSFSSIPRATS